MRKTSILLLALCLNIPTWGQTIVKDEVNSQGERLIITSMDIARDFKDKEVFSVGLFATQTNDTEKFFLCIKVTSFEPYKIKLGSVLLMKTTNNEVVTLNAFSDYDASVREVHDVNGYIFSDYSTIALYPIDKDQITTLTNGVLKIRQETFAGTHNKEYKKDKMGAFIKKDFELVSSALQKKKDIYDGF